MKIQHKENKLYTLCDYLAHSVTYETSWSYLYEHLFYLNKESDTSEFFQSTNFTIMF